VACDVLYTCMFGVVTVIIGADSKGAAEKCPGTFGTTGAKVSFPLALLQFQHFFPAQKW